MKSARMWRTLSLKALLFAGLLVHLTAANDDLDGDPVVRTPLGAVRGTTMTSRSGRTIYAFRGLRYGKPPVGDLRFKAPVPAAERWEGIKSATEDAASCPQASNFLWGPTAEDCLFLNVYSTKLRDKDNNPGRPVIFWIHHGAWAQLSGQSSFTGPQYLLDEDIVLVAINYRLGALGFLSTGDSVVPGNNGLKDQLLALKWVHDNIESFGGNPDLVTIYGYSAGAASVQYHMASPESAGLFHRAISASGSALSGWALARDPMRQTRRMAEFLSCPHDANATSRQIVDCLKWKDAEEIAKSYFNLTEWQFDPLVIFAPVIESEGSSDQPFLTQDPDMLFQTGNFNQVPWMTGFTSKEMLGYAAYITQNETILEDYAHNFEQIAPIAFYYERETLSSLIKSARLKEFYFPDGLITNDSLPAITDLYTDFVFLHGADHSVKLISAVSRSPVYYYQFVYRGRFGELPIEPGTDRPPGPVHHDDLIYLFYGNGTFPLFTDEFPEAAVTKRHVRMWANFAKTGNPTPDAGSDRDDHSSTVNWTPHTPTGLAYMEIGEELVMKRALWQDRAAVWEEISPPAWVADNRPSPSKRKS